MGPVPQSTVAAEAAARAEATLPPDEQGAAQAFVAQYFHGADPDDLARLSTADAAGAALSHYRLARVRVGTDAIVRVANPDLESDGWSSPHTVVEIVSDDMPFLVDSAVGALTSRGLEVQLVLHPTALVRRDADGRLVDVLPHDATKPREGYAPESYLHLEVDRLASEDERASVAAELGEVLADVQVAVADWAAMRARAVHAASALGAAPPPTVDSLDVKEAAAFLEWLAHDHFTFLGSCEYDLVTDADGEDALRLVPGSELGILRRRAVSEYSSGFARMPPEVRRRGREPIPLTLTKAQPRATVHRMVPLDYVGVKRFDAEGAVVGECRFVGLYTSTAYTEALDEVPLLRRKAADVLRRAELVPQSHDAKALATILATFPRDDMLRVSSDELFSIAMGILRIGDRRQVRVFVSRDGFGRFVSCLVYLPRDRYTTDVRVAILQLLRDAFRGADVSYDVLVSEAVLARLHVIVDLPDPMAEVDVAALEERIAAVVRAWSDRLRDELIAAHGEDLGLERFRRYGQAFTPAYQADVPAAAAVADVEVLEGLDPAGDLVVRLEQPRTPDEPIRAKLFRSGAPLVLSDILPLLEQLGVVVVDERPYEVTLGHDARAWIYSFGLRAASADRLADPAVQACVADVFLGVWSGAAENDGLNRLVVVGGLDAREVVLLRALCRYLRQTSIGFSEAYIADALVANARAAKLLVDLFCQRFDPALHPDPGAPTAAKADATAAELHAEIDRVRSLDEDRILRALAALVGAVVRTNAFQPGADGKPKPEVVCKLDPRALEFVPQPRPRHEIWVYSSRTEGVHLRAGFIARGGIRWSDRREDFRTEILGLMKTQNVKNAVIVPVGAKGGFFVKRAASLPDRDALAAEGVACYRAFIGGLLDVTDDIVDGAIVHPAHTVRYDQEDDAYLVVAADKGTASFSDLANSIATERGFWLDDAFASGGSAGYDHKEMGITARGAWESLRAHGRALGFDPDRDELTCVGIGDMSGDVFGNGLLRSPHLKLVAAFDHRHVFLDPAPDPAASYAERARLFALPRSSWADYDPARISTGGGVFPRDAKSVPVSPEVRAALGIEATEATPDELIRAVLRAPVDFLWNGGIGTFVKASAEQHAQVGDRTNDGIRIDAAELRSKAVVEGGNLGFTQAGRVEYALAGGRINTDAIDNSAGVDCSDHEVNLKILLGIAETSGRLDRAARDRLLVEMTDEVAMQVLADNTAQATALELALAEAASLLEVHEREIERFEARGALTRELEDLPSQKEIAERHASGRGLTAPELAVLLAYTKIGLARELLGSDLPDDPALAPMLVASFPSAAAAQFGDLVPRHPLRREILSTVVANTLVNHAGITFLMRLGEETGAPPARLARAHLVARDVFDVTAAWDEIDALGSRIPLATRTAMLFGARRLVERACRRLLRREAALDVTRTAEELRAPIQAVLVRLPGLLAGTAAARFAAQRDELVANGVPEPIATRAAGFDHALGALDVVDVATEAGADVLDAAAAYFAISERLELESLREAIAALPRTDRWRTEARAALRDTFYDHHRAITLRVLRESASEATPVEAWIEGHRDAVERLLAVRQEVDAIGTRDLASLSVLVRELGDLARSGIPRS